MSAGSEPPRRPPGGFGGQNWRNLPQDMFDKSEVEKALEQQKRRYGRTPILGRQLLNPRNIYGQEQVYDSAGNSVNHISPSSSTWSTTSSSSGRGFREVNLPFWTPRQPPAHYKHFGTSVEAGTRPKHLPFNPYTASESDVPTTLPIEGVHSPSSESTRKLTLLNYLKGMKPHLTAEEFSQVADILFKDHVDTTPPPPTPKTSSLHSLQSHADFTAQQSRTGKQGLQLPPGSAAPFPGPPLQQAQQVLQPPLGSAAPFSGPPPQHHAHQVLQQPMGSAPSFLGPPPPPSGQQPSQSGVYSSGPVFGPQPGLLPVHHATQGGSVRQLPMTTQGFGSSGSLPQGSPMQPAEETPKQASAKTLRRRRNRQKKAECIRAQQAAIEQEKAAIEAQQAMRELHLENLWTIHEDTKGESKGDDE